jgi:hypothetical protein
MTYSLESIDHERGEVRLRIREWDGIDRPDYITLSGLSPDQAVAWSHRLDVLAGEAAEWLKQNAAATRAELLKKRDQLAAQIAEIDAKVR